MVGFLLYSNLQKTLFANSLELIIHEKEKK